MSRTLKRSPGAKAGPRPRSRLLPTRELELSLPGPVAGVDEVGRGPLAGPVVAAAVILPEGFAAPLDDSKRLTEARREALYEQLMAEALVGIGAASVCEIDEINILQASFLAMSRAVAALPAPPVSALVDGNRAPALPCTVQTVVKGDQICSAIAAASIVAKVTRDRHMQELDASFPHYGWAQNKGYGTAAHMAAIEANGITEHHRASFAPIRKILSPAS